jgi:hypothetical protein
VSGWTQAGDVAGADQAHAAALDRLRAADAGWFLVTLRRDEDEATGIRAKASFASPEELSDTLKAAVVRSVLDIYDEAEEDAE